MAALTQAANRTARAILQWSIRGLAEKALVAFSTLHRLEKTGTCRAAVEIEIKSAFAACIVEITNGEDTGARLRGPVSQDTMKAMKGSA